MMFLLLPILPAQISNLPSHVAVQRIQSASVATVYNQASHRPFLQAQAPNGVPFDVLPPQEIVQTQDIRPLPGKLDTVSVFNSNSPEVVQAEGILLSTFPQAGKLFPAAHLPYTFQGRFDIFAHHIARANTLHQPRTLYLGILAGNPGDRPVAVDFLQGASYLTSPEALFVNLPPYVEDPLGTVFSGPGSRAVGDVLRGRRQATLPSRLVIPARQTMLLLNTPIPLGRGALASNGRSTLMRLNSSGPIYLASLAMFAPLSNRRQERIPAVQDWNQFLQTARLAGPRDMSPTSPLRLNELRMTYGRVAGVAQGSLWAATLTDKPGSTDLSIPKPGQAIAYGISTVPRGTMGTKQVQSAPLLVRYPDTAHLSHGNYGVEYNLKLPLHNTTRKPATVIISLQTPIKEDVPQTYARFFDPPEERIFFRGPVRISQTDEQGNSLIRYLHLVQRRGDPGVPLLRLTLKPDERRAVEVALVYPPDATPPQVLSIQTLDLSSKSFESVLVP